MTDGLIDTTLRKSGFNPDTAEGKATRELVKAGLDPRLSSEEQLSRIQRSVQELMKSK